MKQSRLITWLVFFVGAIAVADVLAWVSWRLVTLERQQEHSRAETARQEAIGRALWRMDSIVLPLLAVESARPYWEYQAFYPANRAADQMWLPPEPGDLLVPSPLLGEPGDLVRLHFERDADGRLTSPQAPLGPERAHAVAVGVPEALLARADLRLYELDRLSTIDWARANPPAESPRLDLLMPASDEALTGRSLGAVFDDADDVRFVQPDAGLAPGFPATPPRLVPENLQTLTSGSITPPPSDLARSPEPDATLAQAPASEPAPDATKETVPPDVRQDYSARQQANLNAQTYNDAGRANRGRGLEARSASPPPTLSESTTPGPGPTTAETRATELADPPARPTVQEEQGRAPAPASPESQPAGQPVPPLEDRDVVRREREAPADAPPGAPAGRAPPGHLSDESVASDQAPPLEAPRTEPLVLQSTIPDTTPLVAMWRGPGTPGAESALVLVRRATVAGQSREQGVWIDWPALRRSLEASVADLFPLAEVRPLSDPTARAPSTETQRLATLPVVLIPGPLAAGILPPAPGFWTPTRWTLLVGWIAVSIAVLAIGVVLRKAIDLGERRGRFVSAVTHELRTPLTTFRLYSQMLAGSAVTDENKRQRYAQTLDRESQRLSGIVESVLEYARLGRRASPSAARQRLTAAAILDRVRPALIGRAERAGMDLVLPDSPPEATILADPDRVERVLLNLVDNACKYASDVPDRRIVLDAALRDGRLVLGVRDFGPGVPPAERKRIFNAFHRAKHHDQSASPGLGLGLALSRGLAREMGGELRLADGVSPGARFELSIPVA